MHLNEKVFSDAGSFLPERWLSDGKEESVNRIKEMNRWFWAFGSGGRMCIGNHFATHSRFHHLCLMLTQLGGLPEIENLVLIVENSAQIYYSSDLYEL
jgi:hypothetical protein